MKPRNMSKNNLVVMGICFDWEFDTDWTSALEDLDQKHLDMVHKLYHADSPRRSKKSGRKRTKKNWTPVNKVLKLFIEDKDPGDVQSFLNGAARTGSQYGAEHEMYESLNSAVKIFWSFCPRENKWCSLHTNTWKQKT